MLVPDQDITGAKPILFGCPLELCTDAQLKKPHLSWSILTPIGVCHKHRNCDSWERHRNPGLWRMILYKHGHLLRKGTGISFPGIPTWDMSSFFWLAISHHIPHRILRDLLAYINTLPEPVLSYEDWAGTGNPLPNEDASLIWNPWNQDQIRATALPSACSWMGRVSRTEPPVGLILALSQDTVCPCY